MKKLLALTSTLAFCSAGMAHANDGLIEDMNDPNQWAIQTGDYKNQRFSKLDSINTENVGDLQVAWTMSTGVLRGHEGSPLVVGDTMYLHTPFPNIVYALDLTDGGKIKWKYEPKQDPDVIPVMCCDTVNRGVAYAEGKVFLHQADTTVVALDAETGEVVWSKVNGDPAKGETNTATVLPVKDKIIVGISGGEFGVRGHVTAYNIETGEQEWRAYSMGPDSDILMDPENTTHLGELDEPLGLALGVGAGVEEGGGSGAGDRDRCGDRRTLNALDAAHPKQRRRHRGAGVARRDHCRGVAISDRLGRPNERGVLHLANA